MMESFECPNCMVGRCRLEHQTFVTRYGKGIFCAPNTEVYVCDMCGYHELPHRVLTLFDKLLKPPDTNYTQSPSSSAILSEKTNLKKLSRM